MAKNKFFILISLFFILMIAGIIFADLAGSFNYSDVPFIFGVLLYFLVIAIQQATSKTTFLVTIFLLAWMGLSYIPTGAGTVTERIGEWFYLFFMFGFIQYMTEAWIPENKSVGDDENVDWDSYYMNRIDSEKKEIVRRQLQEHSHWYINWIGYIDNKISLYNSSLRMYEVGSGMGGVLTILYNRGVPVVGSDISKRAKLVFQTINPKVMFYICDIQRLIPQGGTYDRILAFEVLEHLKNLDRSIENIRKALRRGGSFVGTTPHPYPHTINAPTHINVHEPEFWKKLFLRHGFTSVQTYPMSLPPFFWRIHPTLNFVLPFYVPFRNWISTTLIIARK